MSAGVSKTFSLIAAVSPDWGIGYQNAIPWPRLKTDLKFLKTKSTNTKDPQKQNAVIIGRKTWDSLPPNVRPLPGRFTVVLSRQQPKEAFPGAHLVSCSLTEAVDTISSIPLADKIESVYILGGSTVYEEALKSPLCDRVYLTHIEKVFPVDTYFPAQAFQNEGFKQISEDGIDTNPIEENGVRYSFAVYKKQ